MKAIVCVKYGSPEGLELQQVEKPVPGEREVLIKIYAATVTSGDVMVRRLTLARYVLIWPFARVLGGMKNLRKRVLGHEFAGEIEAVGKSVNRFKRGDQVFGTTTGFSSGAHAEYICLPEDGLLAIKPAGMTHEQAAAVPVGAMTALYILRGAHIQSGQKVLVYGASGSVGTFAVQIAKASGAEVTGVCSGRNLELVTSLGADAVIDYTKGDFSETSQRFDVVFDAVGKLTMKQAKRALTSDGKYLSVRSSTKEKIEDLLFIKELIEKKKIRSVIDNEYPLEQTPEAHRYVELGHKRGNVVIRVG